MSQRAKTLQASGWQGVFYLTGGGSRLISELLTTSGASKTVLEVSVPYANLALADLLGRAPEQACSVSTARALAMCAMQRAQVLGSTRPFGLGCTAGLATDRVKRGAHRAHVAIQTLTRSLDLRFDYSGSRRQEEAALLESLWYALSTALDVELSQQSIPASSRTLTNPPVAWRALLAGTCAATMATPSRTAPEPKLLLPGSFNPLHRGHRRMLRLAEQQLQTAGAYELSITNVDKPSLDYSTIKERVAPFKGRLSAGPLWLTALPTFAEKARRFPGATFAVGVDTIARIAQTKYYASARARDAIFKEFAQLETRFLVFGRTRGNRFQTLEQLSLPTALQRVCIGISEQMFREDASSTALRHAQQRTVTKER